MPDFIGDRALFLICVNWGVVFIMGFLWKNAVIFRQFEVFMGYFLGAVLRCLGGLF